MGRLQRKTKSIQDEKNEITQRVVQYIDDPNNSSALAKIHEMSNKAKRSGKSPSQFHRSKFLRIEDNEPVEKVENINNFDRRKSHFPTVKQKNLNFFNSKQKESGSDKDLPIPKEKHFSRSNIYNLDGGNVKYKTEYVWDKSINRLVEKKIPIYNTYNKNEIMEEKEKVPEKKIEIQPKKQIRKEVEIPPKKQIQKEVEIPPKRQIQKETVQQPKKYIINEKETMQEIKEDKDKEEKGEIIEKLKQFKINNEKNKKNQFSKESDKGSKNMSEKKIVRNYEEEFEEDDDVDAHFGKGTSDSKNTKYYQKIVKNEPGSKVIITKKVIEETIEQKEDKLVFDNDDSDDEDIKRELQKLKMGDIEKGNIKVKVITEEYDEKGNKIYRKEVTTNKLPKGLKGKNRIEDEFEQFEDEDDE